MFVGGVGVGKATRQAGGGREEDKEAEGSQGEDQGWHGGGKGAHDKTREELERLRLF